MPSVRAPREPSEAEVAEHRRNGCQPPRAWCRLCIAARGISSPHRMHDGERITPVISMHYCYPGAKVEADKSREQRASERYASGEEAEEEAVPTGSLPTLVMHDAGSGAIYAFTVGRKGAHDMAITKAVDVLESLGYKRVVVKNDQEPSLVALSEAVQERWSGESIPEESPS